MNVDYSLMHSVATVFAFVAFCGVCWWAYRPANRERFEADGRLPLENDPIALHKQNSLQEKGE